MCGRVATDDVRRGVVIGEASLLTADDGEGREDTEGVQVLADPKRS